MRGRDEAQSMNYCGFLRGLALILLLLGSPIAMAQGKPSVAADGGYVIGIDDVIEISLVGVDSYKVRAKVQADGSVPLPYGQSVTAADKTALQLSREVRSEEHTSELTSIMHLSYPVFCLKQKRKAT